MRFSIRPVYVAWATFVAQLPSQLFVTAIFAYSFTSVTASIRSHGTTVEAPDILTSPIFAEAAALAFILYLLIANVGKSLNYSRAEYRFFSDHLEFQEGLLAVNRKIVPYGEIREITLHRGFLQRLCGLGTIYLATSATGTISDKEKRDPNAFPSFGFGNISASGMVLRDIGNPDEELERICRTVKPEPCAES